MACEVGFQQPPPIQKGVAKEEERDKYQFSGDKMQV